MIDLLAFVVEARNQKYIFEYRILQLILIAVTVYQQLASLLWLFRIPSLEETYSGNLHWEIDPGIINTIYNTGVCFIIFSSHF
jgi:hypothetical protein